MITTLLGALEGQRMGFSKGGQKYYDIVIWSKPLLDNYPPQGFFTERPGVKSYYTLSL